MNSRQARKLRRYITKNLYNLIYENGAYDGKTGCYEYDLYPSQSKMYIDFPTKGDKIYVRIPSFHLFNSVLDKTKGTTTIIFSLSEKLKSLQTITSLKDP